MANGGGDSGICRHVVFLLGSDVGFYGENDVGSYEGSDVGSDVGSYV
jgi:hypothetical protein